MTQDELAQANSDEQKQELGEASESSLQDTQDTSSGDPLDAIEDVATLRGEAKKFRSIAQRKSEKKPEPKPAAPIEQATGVLTKTDLARINTKKAKELAQEQDPEIFEHWDAIIPFASSFRGQDTEREILEAMRDGHAAWKRTQPAPKPATGAEALTTTPVVKRGGATPQETGRKTESQRPKKQGIGDWYKKPE